MSMLAEGATPRRRAMVALLAAAAGLLLAACDQPPPPVSLPPAEVGVVTMTPQPVRFTDEFNGRVEAAHEVQVRPRVSGYLDRVAYREGDRVARGDLLFVIDQRPYRIALERAEAQLARMQAGARLAQVQLDRVQTLAAARATSQEELDNARANDAQVRADVRAAQAAVDDARLNLSFTQVRAPIDGRAGRALLTVGNLASADQSVLTSVVAQDPLYVYFDCDESRYLSLTRGRSAGRTEASAGIGEREVSVALANESGFAHRGVINFLDNRMNPETGTIRVRVRLDAPDARFTPGLYARVRLSLDDEALVMMVDEKAVLTDQDRQYLYVIGPDDKALRRDVRVGRARDGQREIVAGLSEGDRVVVAGLQRIFYPGAPVKPIEQVATRQPVPSAAPLASAR